MTVLILLLSAAELPFLDSSDFTRELQQQAMAATVRITNKANRGEGSGVIVRQTGPFVYILTANHVVEGADTVDVATFSPTSYPKPEQVYGQVQVVARAKGPDLALVRLVTRDPMPGVLRLCPPDKAPAAGEFPALTCGLKDRQAPACWIDAVAGKQTVRKPTGEVSQVWELKRAPALGRSGGPLIDKRGYVIGIGSGRSDGKGYYAHLDEVYRFLKQNDQMKLIGEGKE
jgi:S1-C subfamily serine protease